MLRKITKNSQNNTQLKSNNKTLLITGGTGSFGNAVLRRFLKTDVFSEIRIFSRDEKKQDDMRQFYRNKRIKYYIGHAEQPQSRLCHGRR